MDTPLRTWTLGALAARRPEAIEVLERFRLDYCCGGRQTVEEACAARRLDPATVEAAVAALSTTGPSSLENVPLAELIDHLLTAFHAPHRESFEALRRMADKVVWAHGQDAEWGPRLVALRTTLCVLADELEEHMQKEEKVLFPWIRSGQGHSAGAPIRVMQSEHEYAAVLLGRLRTESLDYLAPIDACTTLQGFLAGLARLERELHEHMHLENNVLFPRALGG